jgi:5-methylcytosine-specific restriction endonuclease McrA
MKEKILKLRQEGKTYDQIRDILGCSKGTIAYHCGKGQKDKTRRRIKKSRSSAHPLKRKIENFKARRALKTKTEKFQCRVSLGDSRKISGSSRCSMKDVEINFRGDDVIKKFGSNPKCALSGREISWEKSSSYVLDHIIPVQRGGDNSLDNLQLLNPQINMAKSNLTDEEFISLCKEVLEHQGYKVA